MKTDKTLLIAEVYRKAEIKSYERMDERTRKPVVYNSYPILLDDGVNVSTVNVPEHIYDIVEERKKYVFTCSVNTDSQYASSRFTINGLLDGVEHIDGREDFAIVPRGTLSNVATKEAKTK